jgi:hypothetical protein
LYNIFYRETITEYTRQLESKFEESIVVSSISTKRILRPSFSGKTGGITVHANEGQLHVNDGESIILAVNFTVLIQNKYLHEIYGAVRQGAHLNLV